MLRRPQRLLSSFAILLLAVGAGALDAAAPAADNAKVGPQPNGQGVTPVNQILTPHGRQLHLPGMRPQAVALSPNGRILVTAGKTNEIVVVDPDRAVVVQRVALPAKLPENRSQPETKQAVVPTDTDGQLSYNGLIFSPQGDRLYMSDVNGSIKVFDVDDSGHVEPSFAWSVPDANAPRRKAEAPSGLAVSTDGSRLYVCGNLSNRLFELDTDTGEALRVFDVGVAPFDVVLMGEKAYVSNWGGRRPEQGDLTGPAGRGTVVRVDPVRHIASEGSVSVVDLASGQVRNEIITGRHASGLASSPAHPYLICCNSESDHLSVIDTRTDSVVATLWTKASPADLLGAAPNAAAFDAAGRRLYVANGSQNAVAVFDFDADEPEESKLIGLVPVGWYPGAVLVDDARNTVVAANIKGLAERPKDYGGGAVPDAKGFNSHHYHGSLSLFEIPADEQLAELSEQVSRNLRTPRIADALLPARPDQSPRPIPERIGEPSLIKHVVYIIKENRTFDQVLGKIGRGDCDPSLCIFGPEIAPNHYKIARDFVLLDNTYCCGILSADGHQWSTTAYSTDYMEKSFAGFPRSYPDGMGVDEDDALAYASSGFLWDSAIKHGVSIRNYGEFMGPSVRWRDPNRQGSPDFTACYQAWKNGTDDVVFACWPSVETLRDISPLDYVGWEMSVPDQYRADFVLRELAEFEKKGEYPRLTIICLPNDHASGTRPGCPTPAACIADNDLAFGRILEGLSHSKFWPEMAVFAIEDDPQAGWDHVSGYRTIAFCASPYAKRGALVSTQYNTTSVLRTIEQILGLPPMNQFDASATPMFDCFVDEPDPTPYDAAPALVPLDQMNPDPAAITDPVLREDALVSASLDFEGVDRAPEDVLNRILWRAMRGTSEPYPEWAITAGADEDDDD
ncbi:Phosphoesterase family protein [Posidoniimonas polymericola]|uniref:Phosphoesterase family protein n=1 Tax=Posidoniimonas polymericola TaxID=2528002 RepID=A0A5C5YKY4_9BACT|nr:bifunctional YncE family protein/alkaline phosphatase family protein [Posidoniimonas polymericola]TWT75479.1 Phosphoesterase family protein [Posidoniimonas polymericola]